MYTHKRADRQTDKLSDTVNLPPKRVSNADVSSSSPSSELMLETLALESISGRPS